MADDLARRLFRTVARAFYDDDVVVVADALTREPYIMDDEKSQVALLLQEKFSLQSKQVRKSLQTLYLHQLIEKVELDYKAPDAPKGTRAKKYLFWYINYFHFVKLVRLRVAMMERIVNQSSEKRKLHDNNLGCPRCKKLYTLGDVVSRIDSEGRFYCPSCHSDTYDIIQLEEIKVKETPVEKTIKTDNIIQRIKDQMKEELPLRMGIMDYLAKLDNFPKPPSDNNPKRLIEIASEDAERRAIERETGKKVGGGHGMRRLDSQGNEIPDFVINIQGLDSQKDESAEKESEEDANEGEALAPWMTRNVVGGISGSAIQDAKEREANRHAKSRGNNLNISVGGASDRLKRQRGEASNDDIQLESPKSARVEVPTVDSTKTILVGGEEKLLKDITEEDQNKMSNAEYEQYMKALKGNDDAEDSEEDDEDVDFF